MNPIRSRRLPYIPSLDGIRALAVAAVVLYHLSPRTLPGGMLGVTVFFVLSGYLITRLLVAEFVHTHRIDLKDFWIRRLRRLLPATLAVVVVTAALCTVCNHVMLTKMRPDILPSLLFCNNWWQIAHDVSYFSKVGDPSPLTHFWSLAVEMQFYLVWPLVLLAAFRLHASPRTMRRTTLALAAASALAMALLYTPGADPSRVYYRTDTRAFSLLMGCWLALVPPRALTPQAIGQRARRLGRLRHNAAEAAPGTAPAGIAIRNPLDALGATGLLGLVALALFTNGYDAFSYRGGTVLATALALAMVLACSRPGSLLARPLAWGPLVWVGKRSYSIYLWHYPLLLLMNPASDVSQTPWWMYALQVALVVAVAALCYRFIETPFRHGALGRTLRAVRQGRDARGAFARRHAVPLAGCAAFLLVACGGLALVPNTSALSAEGAALLQDGAPTEADDKPADTDGQDVSGGGQGAGTDQATGAPGSAKNADAPAETDNTNPFPADAFDVLMIGDSVSLRAVPYFERTFPHGHIDALKNRQFSAGTAVYDTYLQEHKAGKISVFALGTNGPVSDQMVDALMAKVGDARIAVFVNTRHPDAWEGDTNAALSRAAERYSNVRVVDWYGYSTGKNELFDGDGTHLSEQGAQAYVQLIYSSIQDALPAHPEDQAQADAADAPSG